MIEKLNKKIPSPFRVNLTRDRWTENVNYIKQKLGLDVYFAHSYHSWEKDSNESNNGLLRRFFPKWVDFAKVSDEALARAEYLLKTRPRKRLGSKTHAEVFYGENCVEIYFLGVALQTVFKHMLNIINRFYQFCLRCITNFFYGFILKKVYNRFR